MGNKDLIQNASAAPGFEDISNYFSQPVQSLWRDLNDYIQTAYRIKPKIEFSQCALQRGWNIKYKKAGQSLCTLYPEPDCFIALVVIKTDMIPAIENHSPEFERYVLDLVNSARPMKGILWLMIRVDSEAILGNVKRLMFLKQAPKA